MCRKKVYRRLLYILYFSKKKKKNKKIVLSRYFICGNRWKIVSLQRHIKGFFLLISDFRFLIGLDRQLLPVAGGFFYSSWNGVFSRSKAFSFRSCIIYHPIKENGANRKIDKNNFPDILKAFSDGFCMVFISFENQQVTKIIENNWKKSGTRYCHIEKRL